MKDKHYHHDDHTHHSHDNRWMLYFVIIASIIYLSTLLWEPYLPTYLLIGMYVVSIVMTGFTTFRKGLRNLFAFRFNMDTLMTIALIGAFAIGEWKEATLVAILFGLNEYLEHIGMSKAHKSMSALLQSAPKQALLLKDGNETIVSIEALQAGDIVKVKPGDKIPSDGTVIEGHSSINEAIITGESLPAEKSPGEPVFGGSINNEGVLLIRIERAYKDSSLSNIFRLVHEAQLSKTPTELFINKFAKYYTPLILVIALIVVFVPPLLLQQEWSKWIYQGLAVLIVGCPCALILSSPVAILSGITRSARDGILIKGGSDLEQLGRIRAIAFDKTGTLTKGEPYVEETISYDDERFYQIAAAIESNSSHPLAKAIMKEIDKRSVQPGKVDEFYTITGQGIKAVISGDTYFLGNEKQMKHLQIPEAVTDQINLLKERGLTLAIVADSTRILGIFGIADEIREESRSVIQKLHQNGIRKTMMLTGDHEKSAQRVADAVGVTTYISHLLPEQKAEHIRSLAKQGSIAMVGDGINDAPALAEATLGIAMGKGTDSAIETADIVLMQDHLGKLPDAISTAKRVNAIIRFNISIALGLKLVALFLTIPGLLTLWLAIMSDMGATILVTITSLTVLIGRKRSLAT